MITYPRIAFLEDGLYAKNKADGRDPGEERVGVANSRDMVELYTVS